MVLVLVLVLVDCSQVGPQWRPLREKVFKGGLVIRRVDIS